MAGITVQIISKRLFPKTSIPFYVAFSLAVMPWHIHFSRGAWEANLSLTLILAGIYFFLRSVQEKSGNLLLSAIFFALSLWAYQGAKLGTSLVVLALAIVYFEKLIKFPKKNLILSLVVGMVVASPVILSLLTGKAGRLEVYSVFSYYRSSEYINSILIQGDEKVDGAIYFLYHSEPLNFLRGILGRYLNHYSGRFLFFEGDWSNPRHSVPYQGALLFIDCIFLVTGIISLIKSKFSKGIIFITLWILLSPLPSALSRDSIHAVRSLAMTAPLAIIIGVGFYSLKNWIQKDRKRIILGILIVGAYFANYIYFLDQYKFHLPARNSKDWHYGYKQIVEKITPIQSFYKEVIIQQDYTQPYIFFLFYQKYDPLKYQAKVKDVFMSNSLGDVGLVSELDNLKFVKFHLPGYVSKENILLVGDPFMLPEIDINDKNIFNIIGEIKHLNGSPAFKLIETKQTSIN